MRPFLHPFAQVTAEMRTEAIETTDRVLGELERLRKRHELPIEQLPLVAEIYIGALGSLADKAQEDKFKKRAKKMRERMMADQPGNDQVAPMFRHVSRPSPMGIPMLGDPMFGFDVDDDD
jgi:hypothetical protein